jgi:hypothetical protein
MDSIDKIVVVFFAWGLVSISISIAEIKDLLKELRSDLSETKRQIEAIRYIDLVEIHRKINQDSDDIDKYTNVDLYKGMSDE